MIIKRPIKLEQLKRVLSIILIYTLFLQELIPLRAAINSISEKSSHEPIFSTASYIEKAEIVEYTNELNSIIEDVLSSEKFQSIKLTTAGPGQSETSGFSLGSTDGMVDKFTGDFTYSIPLMDMEGFPIVINYNANVGMNTDATWVGLGWNLNVGSVAREMRGLPDEFNGDQKIRKITNQLDNATDNGVKVGAYVAWSKSKKNGLFEKKLYPSVQFTALFGSYDNTYTGSGSTFDMGLQSSFSIGENIRFGPSFGLGFSRDSKNGIGRNTNFGLQLSGVSESGLVGGASLSFSKNFNSRYGLMSKSTGLGAIAGYEERGVARYSSGTSMTYGSITSIPSIRLSGRGTSFLMSTDVSVNIESSGNIFSIGLLTNTYWSLNKLDYPNDGHVYNQPAFGYLHSGKRKNYVLQNHEYPVMDFNRTGDFEYSEEMKNLPFSLQTYDIFRANSLGMSGSFRARRDDVGTYYDPEADNKLKGKNLGFSLGLEPDEARIEIGASLGVQNGNTESGNWNTSSVNAFEFKNEDQGSNFDEAVYFKSIGEPTPNDLSVLEEFNENKKTFVQLFDNSGEIAISTNLVKEEDFSSQQAATSVFSGSTINTLNDAPIVSTQFTPKTGAELTSVNPTYFSRDEGAFITSNSDVLNRITTVRAQNHISVIDIVSDGGMRYTYGIPAYNMETNEVAFSVGNTPSNQAYIPDVATNLIRYQQGDNSISNVLGRSHFYDKTTVPAYAHSFLLTEMKSADYVDVNGDGLTPDDVGSYYKINHTQIYGDANASSLNYKWRFPVSDDQGKQAMFNQGFLGSDLDNMANYSYGEKEIWYTHSIESKNLIVEFHLEDREDAYGVLDEDGKLDVNSPLRLLKKIILYNRADRINNGANAIPLQTVVFYYDYSLCKESPSNKHTYAANLDIPNSGKLTLKEIRVFSGESNESGLSKYSFEYHENNPNFSYQDTDSWGNYKPNDGNKPNNLFPYSVQNVDDANNNINSWKLVAINNPMGGRVEVSYEADRYKTVQNKRAMRHIDVYKMTNLIEFLHLKDQSTWNGFSNVYNDFRKDFGSNFGLQSWFNSNGYGTWNSGSFEQAVFAKSGFAKYAEKFGKFKYKFVPNNVIIFKLEKPLTGTESVVEAKVKDDYFRKNNSSDYLDKVYFKMHVNVKTGVEELVPVFADVSADYINPFGNLLPYEDDFNAIGVMPPNGSGVYEYGYVVVDPVNTGSRENKNNSGDDKNGVLLSPLQRTALDFVRQNLPDQVYGSCDGCDANLSVDNITFFGGDMYKYMISKGGYVESFDPNKSTMRLFEPDSVKIGGNARVSKIIYKDNWDAISGEYIGEYSWEYFYPARNQESGVASFEPRVGIDECSFYEWDSYVNAKKKFPDETRFTPTPVTGALFPIPVVGYADVRVQFSGAMGYGYSKAEFYTAKDFPTIEKVSNIESTLIEKKNIITGNTLNLYGFTQGFVIETNDFHGKPKEFSVFKVAGANDVLQSRSTYYYNDLDQKVKMIDREGMISEESIAMEYDIHADSKFYSDSSNYKSIGLSLGFVIGAFFPFTLSPTLSITKRVRGFYSHTIVKHINRSAVINRIETEYLNSRNTAQNLLYDKYTGNVLLSSLKDEYEDELYSLSYPSHWYQRELRDVFPTVNQVMSVNITLSEMDFSSVSNEMFSQGDQFSITDGVSTDVVWVLSIDGTNAKLINEDGTVYSGITGLATVTLLKSGRKNRLQETMQSVVTKEKIDVIIGNTLVFPELNIISSSAINYRDKKNIKCRFGEAAPKQNSEVAFNQPLNPFALGVKGDLVMDSQFAWQAERVNDSHAHKTRFDGTYSEYIPFYKLNPTTLEWKMINEYGHPDHNSNDEYQKWRKMGEVTLYDEYGKALESKDQINVYSSILYSYNNELVLLPTAQAVNAKQQDLAFDGFEDYSYYSNNPLSNEVTHFDFKSELVTGVSISNTVRHSGLSSLELSPGSFAQVDKNVAEDCTPLVEPFDEFIAEKCLCIEPFEPTPGKYIVGAWVKVGNNPTNMQYSDAKIQVILPSGTLTFEASGPVIEGWQRIEGVFIINAYSIDPTISIKLWNASSTEQVYFDDLRIHPYLAGMTTVVYDPVTLLPLATHDGYNFTTFYNYDENLHQVRIKVETIDGIKTISESEFGTYKSLNN